MEEEIWKVCKISRNHIYEVSNFGRARKDGLIINLKLGTQRYLRFANDKLHRLVAKLFIGEIKEGYQIDHIDTNVLNNNVNNLRICTCKENNNNPITRKHKSNSRKGKHHSEETKKKISEQHKGKAVLINGHGTFYGHHHSEESKLRTSKKLKENPPFKGKHHSEETKKKMSEAKKGKIPWNKGLKGSQIGSNTNKHRKYDNEEHTKWHMVLNN